MTFDERVAAEVQTSPEEFQRAFGLLSADDMRSAMIQLERVIASPQEVGDQWIGPAFCCYAYCLREGGDYDGAIEFALKGKAHKLNTTGRWYFYNASVYSLNQVDRLTEALDLAREAVTFFREQEAPIYLAAQLESKANILKQLSAAASRDLNRLDEAKAFAIEALHAYFLALTIESQGWEELAEEFSALVRIAARAGAKESDFAFMDENPAVKSIMNDFVGELTLPRMAVRECFNMAVESNQKGDRTRAREWWKRALSSAREDEPNDRAFKALIAYQYGVCLLNLHGLEGLTPSDINNENDRTAMREIQRAWQQTMDLAATLDPNTMREFDKSLPPGLGPALRNISADPLMSKFTGELTAEEKPNSTGVRHESKKKGCLGSLIAAIVGMGGIIGLAAIILRT